MRKILTSVFAVLVVQSAYAVDIIYHDTTGTCANKWCAVNPGAACCPDENAIEKLTAPTNDQGYIFVGYSSSPTYVDQPVSNLVATGRTDYAWFVNNYDFSSNVLYATYVSPCNLKYFSNATCEIATTDSGAIQLNDNGLPVYQTSCFTGYKYDRGENTSQPVCIMDSEYNLGNGCSAETPQNCTKEQCENQTVDGDGYSGAWMHAFGYAWCYIDGTSQCYSTGGDGGLDICCSDRPWNCKTAESCQAMGMEWNDRYYSDGGLCYAQGTVNRRVYYTCGTGQDNTNYYTEVENGTFTPEQIKNVCPRTNANSKFEFQGYKIQGTDTIINSNQSIQYTYDTPYIILVAQWQELTCDAEHLNLCSTPQDACTAQNQYLCTTPTVFTTNWTWECSANVGNLCCYNSPANCTYRQCKEMNYVWELATTPEGTRCQLTGTDYSIYLFPYYMDNTYGSGAVGELGNISLTTTYGRNIRKRTGEPDNFAYLTGEFAYQYSAYPTAQTQYDGLTKLPFLPGHNFQGYFTEANGAGTKHIDANGNFMPVAINDQTNLYPHFTEIDTTEPANGLIKVYISACQMGKFCGTFGDNNELDHGTYYGPLYYSESAKKFYTDNTGSDITSLPQLVGDNYHTFRTYSVRDLSFYASDYDWNSPQRHYEIQTFGNNNNRAILYPIFNQTLSWYTQNDCGVGGTYAGIGAGTSSAYSETTVNRVCNDIGRNSSVYLGDMLNVPNNDIAPRCQCVRAGCKISGWKVSGTNDIFKHGEPKQWTYTGTKHLVAQWDCD